MKNIADPKIMTARELKARIPQIIEAIPDAEVEAKGIMPYVVFSYIGTDGKEHIVKPRTCGGGYIYIAPFKQTRNRVFRIEYCINDVADAKMIEDGFKPEYLLINELITSITRSMIFTSEILDAPVCFSYRPYTNTDTVLVGIYDCAAEEDEDGHIVIKLKASQDKRYDFDWEKMSSGSGFEFAFAGEYCEYLEWEKQQQAEKEAEEEKAE